ncbi:hypothetical protein EDEG_01826 [Edhazardia aedis USNM 41457]|uniref:Uncharacterized protein n=1 Tax=Edhazardia aedis (strain USNM 41457) TaxID=1003232 RepID=J8ZW17_EDHAE|nr:hypothetical protein EDEG_01826 [Edhazardia aedis USNM 41457]|eukprot:EJW03873.1 hypothetical protein EDEG_01826 [Edhazardia aedis USNM 41457]
MKVCRTVPKMTAVRIRHPCKQLNKYIYISPIFFLLFLCTPLEQVTRRVRQQCIKSRQSFSFSYKRSLCKSGRQIIDCLKKSSTTHGVRTLRPSKFNKKTNRNNKIVSFNNNEFKIGNSLFSFNTYLTSLNYSKNIKINKILKKLFN